MLYAIKEKMAMSLRDVLFRRTGLRTLKHPGRDCLQKVCSLMAREHEWNKDRCKVEMERVDRAYKTS